MGYLNRAYRVKDGTVMSRRLARKLDNGCVSDETVRRSDIAKTTIARHIKDGGCEVLPDAVAAKMGLIEGVATPPTVAKIDIPVVITAAKPKRSKRGKAKSNA